MKFDNSEQILLHVNVIIAPAVAMQQITRFFVYMTVNKVNGKMYIGKCCRDHPRYLGSGLLLNAALRKYGFDNFYRLTLQYCTSKQEASVLEKYWIAYFEAASTMQNTALFYNITRGDEGRTKEHCSESTKAKLSRAHKGKSKSAEAIRNMQIAQGHALIVVRTNQWFYSIKNASDMLGVHEHWLYKMMSQKLIIKAVQDSVYVTNMLDDTKTYVQNWAAERNARTQYKCITTGYVFYGGMAGVAKTLNVTMHSVRILIRLQQLVQDATSTAYFNTDALLSNSIQHAHKQIDEFYAAKPKHKYTHIKTAQSTLNRQLSLGYQIFFPNTKQWFSAKKEAARQLVTSPSIIDRLIIDGYAVKHSNEEYVTDAVFETKQYVDSIRAQYKKLRCTRSHESLQRNNVERRKLLKLAA